MSVVSRTTSCGRCGAPMHQTAASCTYMDAAAWLLVCSKCDKVQGTWVDGPHTGSIFTTTKESYLKGFKV